MGEMGEMGGMGEMKFIIECAGASWGAGAGFLRGLYIHDVRLYKNA
jgi:hypothetical protein